MSLTTFWRSVAMAVSCIATVCVAQSPEWLRNERAREQFLCRWKEVNARDSTRALDFCGNPNLELGLSLIQQDGFWGDEPRSLKNQFEADWQKSPELAEQARLQREAKERARRQSLQRQAMAEAKRAEEQAEQRAQFDLTVPHLSDSELCAGLHSNGYESARIELRKRNAFTPKEWDLIGSQKIAIGMSEAALICSWGRAPINRMLTANSVHLQYVYGLRTYVYVVNGVVTSIQDTQ